LKSSFWIGYWPPHCEVWYQNHKQQLLNGMVQPLTETEWEDFLRRSYNPPRILAAVENAATDFLAGKYSA
jgi:hypothetical protein